MNTFILIAILVLAIGVPAAIILLLRLRSSGVIAAGWTLDSYSTNVKLAVDGDQFHFDFPPAYPGVHSIMRHIDGLKSGQHVTMTYEITGNAPVFEADGDVPTVGLYLGGARIYTNGPYRIPLALGRKTVVFPVVPEAWQTVDGFPCSYDDAHKRMFEKALGSKTLGPCFGDNHGFAHGVNLASGSATFRLIEFKIA
jgi:hypothetical protein